MAGCPSGLPKGAKSKTDRDAHAVSGTSPPAWTTRLVADAEKVRRALANGQQVLDARSRERFSGAAPEPRAGLRSGHMPGALNLPFTELMNEGRLRPAEELAAAFDGAGVDRSRPVITSCGSGVTAAILSLALAETGQFQAPVYDGSWTDWGGREDTPVVTGDD